MPLRVRRKVAFQIVQLLHQSIVSCIVKARNRLCSLVLARVGTKRGAWRLLVLNFADPVEIILEL